MDSSTDNGRLECANRKLAVKISCTLGDTIVRQIFFIGSPLQGMLENVAYTCFRKQQVHVLLVIVEECDLQLQNRIFGF